MAEARLQHPRIRVQEEPEGLLRRSPDHVDEGDLLVVRGFKPIHWQTLVREY